MDLLTIILIALALAVDAFAVALASGVSLCQVNGRQIFRLAFHFGLFQAGMNIIGWAAGLTVRTLLESIDHWRHRRLTRHEDIRWSCYQWQRV